MRWSGPDLRRALRRRLWAALLRSSDISSPAAKSVETVGGPDTVAHNVSRVTLRGCFGNVTVTLRGDTVAQGNRNMAAKHLRANKQRGEFSATLRSKFDAYERPLSDKAALVTCLTRQPDVVEVAGVTVSRCDDVAARKAARQSIRSVHW